MIRINLIPHREEFREKQILEYITVFATSLALLIAMIIVVDIWSTKGLTDLQDEHAILVTKNKKLSAKIGELRNLDSLRKEVEGKLRIVDELQAGRFRSLNTLNAIATSIPQNIWIKDMKDNSGTLTVSGFGESSKAVANFMRGLEASEFFTDVALQYDEKENIENAEVRKFALTFRRLTLAEQEEQRKAAGDKK